MISRTVTILILCSWVIAQVAIAQSNYERVAALRLGRVHIRVAPIFTHGDTYRIAGGKVTVPHGFIKVIYAADSLTVIACQLFTNQYD